MPSRIEDYALIGDGHTAALVGRDGSIDWLCWPRFDSAACFAALLGSPRHGRWLLAPAAEPRSVSRHYGDGTLILHTEFETPEGAVSVIDCMPAGVGASQILRQVRGRRGRVPMRMELVLRFDYGSTVPWVSRLPYAGGLRAVAGPHMCVLRSDVETHGENRTTVASFEIEAGQCVNFSLAYGPSHLSPPSAADPRQALDAATRDGRDWSARCTYRGPYEDAVRESLRVLRGLIYAPTGGIVAAPTTSLPEQLGGVRNWDYRYCWLRDATLTLLALMNCGYYDEAASWRSWLERTAAGSPEQIQIMYGIAGERRLQEWLVEWLPGYQGSAPVRVGNAAAGQLQLDVYGEVMDALHQGRRGGLATDEAGWELQRALLQHLGRAWTQPDEGIWETRGGKRHFTFSKVMAWVAYDRGIRSAERYRLEAPLEEWKRTRAAIHADVCAHALDAKRGCFVQSYGSCTLDAALLQIPLVGFLPPDDVRVRATLDAIERDLISDGLVMRYDSRRVKDGLPAGEGAFLACSFWLVDNLVLAGRHDDARKLFERLLALRNDVGLLAEEYDPRARRLVGNFPQAFSHIALINSALQLSRAQGPTQQRSHDAQDLRGASNTPEQAQKPFTAPR
ncbi:MAG TPA: glycoside hydrolase family 15 protein [Nevskiaceae bacterium]|nr:glycoside hydrolase family 15 protein [Nevskiaceae bacterium]